MNEALRRLAFAAGIEDRYWDGLGAQRDLQEPTARALLGALDFDANGTEGDADAAVQRLADDAYTMPLPSVIVLHAGEPVVVTVSLPPQQAGEPLAWQIVSEDGRREVGTFISTQLTRIDVCETGGRCYTRFRLPLLPALATGYYRLRLPSLGADAALIVAPARCHIPQALNSGARCWGFAVQLYALRSARNWGVGDFSDLAVLAAAAGRAGAAFIGLNPLHARHLVRPGESSPYAPSSRLFLDPLYIDVEAVAEYAVCAEARAAVASAAFQTELTRQRALPLVDYAAVTALKLSLLEKLFLHFRASGDAARAQQFREFKMQSGQALERFAEFEALRLHLAATTGTTPNWRDWPAEYHDPAGNALAAFRRDATERIEFQMYLQWLASMQLAAAADAAREAGMAIGLYRDVAVGAAHDSAETWGDQALFAHTVSVGAPPDMLNRQGQTWGLPPWKPRRLAAGGYAAFSRLLAANMQGAGALRIDHVMALTRLFWIPAGMQGADGGYVRNDFETLLAIVALESERNQCMVIGEDLGSVPDGLRARLREAGLLSYRVLIYERHWQGDGSFCHPHEYPAQSLATVATHDMPTIAEFWRGGDIARRAALGLYPDERQRDEDTARRAGECAGILRLLGDIGLSPADPADAGSVIESMHAAIARTAAMLAVVQLDDLLGETEPVNIPGTWREYANWQRKLGTPLEAIFNDARWARLAAIMRASGRASPVSPA
jgi:4-alpha-glucanotransferase